MDAALSQAQYDLPQIVEVTGQAIHRVAVHSVPFANEALHGLQLGSLHILAGGFIGEGFV